MFWADKIAKNIIESGKYTPYWVDDMKTPSGRIHVGSLRGMVIHDLVYKALKDQGKDATFTYVFEDHDPMDGMPIYLDAKKWSQYLGQPLFTIPSPDGKAANFGEYFALEFQEVFNKIGCKPKIIWMSEVYKSGKMNDLVKLCLDKAPEIRKIYEEMYEKKLPDNWYPFQVVCPVCGKESTTKVTSWDGKEVAFTCQVDMVDWTKGCGTSGKTSPFSGEGKYAGKLPWKVEWPVKWKVIGVTVEGAGKDHMSRGGSHDIAKLVCDRILKYPVPYPIAYEFFLVGGKKMSSSKGLGTSSKEISEILPPYLLRFLFTRTDYNQAINFDPVGNMYIPDLFDEYDRCWQSYIDGSDENLARAFEMAQIGKLPPKEKIFIPRFRDIVNYIQSVPPNELSNKFSKIKKNLLTFEEEKILRERIDYASIWIQRYAPEEYKMQFSVIIPDETKKINENQKKYLQAIIPLVENANDVGELNVRLYTIAKELPIDTKEAFSAIYLSFLGKNHGPRAAWFLLQYPKEQVIDRLKKISSDSGQARMTINEEKYIIHKPDFFVIDSLVKEKYPSISIGIAFIKNVHVEKTNSNLEQEKQDFLKTLQGLTTEKLGTHPEVLSYRKLYKEMGVDWHSRRPSPEALLRRVALNKGLYTVNTCVDAYNLVVMKHRISVGAFDADQVNFPTVLRYAGEGDELILLGDSASTKYTAKELAYYDKQGGYNIDFNFRDAQRTKVTEKTKNIWVNVDGIFDIHPDQVYISLKESVEKIVTYCGGEVEFMGVVT